MGSVKQLPALTEHDDRDRTIADVRFLLDAGYGPEAVVWKLGRSADRLTKMLRRAGEHDLARIFDAARQRTG